MRPSPSSLSRWFVVSAFVAFLYLPLLGVLLISFSSHRIQAWPLGAPTVDWYLQLLDRSTVKRALVDSVTVSSVVAVLSNFLGFVSAYGLSRRHIVRRLPFVVFVSLPAFTPGVLLGLSALAFYESLSFVPAFWRVIATQVSYVSPFAFLFLFLGIESVDQTHEAAARNLGAGQLQIVRWVVLPQMYRPLVASLLIAFAVSWDEVPITWFLGRFLKTVSVVIYGSLGSSLDPSMYALATLSTLFSFLCLIIGLILIRRGG